MAGTGNIPDVYNGAFDTFSGSDSSVQDALDESKKMNNKTQVSLLQTQAEQQKNQCIMAAASAKVDVVRFSSNVFGEGAHGAPSVINFLINSKGDSDGYEHINPEWAGPATPGRAGK